MKLKYMKKVLEMSLAATILAGTAGSMPVFAEGTETEQGAEKRETTEVTEGTEETTEEEKYPEERKSQTDRKTDSICYRF